ncbi:unnamed protein product [Taenia asiatica]|uniref:Transgelin n=1 Tax=Taenia asiatica TaxID=60517 RepID=A0A0R3W4V1_TAEAS|nr:unnamed protein product [Taenia asiatica]
MEYRAKKSGLSREVQNRINEKYNMEEAGKVLKWIRLLTPPSGISDDLVKAAQEIPEDITSAPAEEFYRYLKSGLVLGYLMVCLRPDEISRFGYNGPEGYWMQRHTENKRNFTEEQLKQGESVMRLQMGYTGGATASGVSFGARRNVTDTF